MKKWTNTTLVVGVLLSTLVAYAGTDKRTLAQVRAKYLGKRVVVTGPLYNPERMLEWYSANPEGNRFVETDVLSLLPSSYKGQVAIVVTVQLNRLKVQTKANALGEMVSEDDIVDPYFDLIVKFDDGSYGMLTSYPTTAEESVTLADEQQGYVDMIKANEQKLVGSTLFACAYARLYEPDTSLEEMTGSREILKRISDTTGILLRPLTIQTLKLVQGGDLLVMKLKLPDGASALAYTPFRMLKDQSQNKQRSPLEQIAGYLLTAIPKAYTPKEVDSVQKGVIFRGMSKDALECAMGFPKKENDWGQGGKQWIFSDTFVVYLDNNDKVVDWQSFDR